MVVLNTSLIRDYDPALSDKMPHNPHVARFSHAGKSLHYIGAAHTEMVTNDAGEVTKYSNNPTIPLIESEIRDYQPDFIVIEAPEFIGSTKSYGEPIKVAKAGVKYSDINEVARSAALAERYGIPYQGGEPDELQLQSEMLRRGYSVQDIMGLYAVRQTLTMNSNGKVRLDEATLEKNLNHYFNCHYSFAHILPEKKLNYQSFLQWFEEKNQDVGLDLLAIDNNDMMPTNKAGATYFQRAMADIGDIREENVNRIIQQAMDKHERVMVVYGSGHLVKSLPVYQEAFGDPQLYEVEPRREPAAVEQPARKVASTLLRGLAAAALGVAVAAGAMYLITGATMSLAVAAAITVAAAGGGYAISSMQKSAEASAVEEKPLTLQPRALAPELSQSREPALHYHQNHAKNYLKGREVAGLQVERVR